MPALQRGQNSRAGDNKPLYLDPPQFEGFEVRHGKTLNVARKLQPQFCYEHHGAIDTLRLEQKLPFLVSGEKSGGSHGSNNALPEMRKTIGPGSHHLRPHRPPMHKL